MSFIYDPALIGFDGTSAHLLLQNNLAQSFLPTLSDSTFDPSFLQYSTSSLNQVDQRPANATFYAAWNSMLNANWSGPGNGSLIVTPFNGATIVSSKLDLTGSTNKYIKFSGINNCDSAQTGTLEFNITPNYSGTPTNQQTFISISPSSSSTISGIFVSHFTDGNIYLQIFDNTNTLIINETFAWNPTSGVTYNFIINFNGAGGIGANQLYIDGVSVITSAIAFDRTGQSLADVTIGKIYNLSSGNANFSIDNLSFYSIVTTPDSPILSETIYSLTTANLPEFSYSGLGNIQAWTNLIITDSNVPGYTFNGLYFNGSIWVVSSGSYAESNTAIFAIAHIATLPAADTLQINVIFPASNLHASLSILEIVYTGQIYPTTGPTISPQIPLTMDQLYSFTDVETAVGLDAISWFLRFGGQNHWFNGSAWVISNGTYGQSNPASVIEANASTLPISLGKFVTPYGILYSNDGSTTPDLTSLTLSYDFFNPPPPGPNKCTVFGYLFNERGTPIVGATITVINPKTFINQGIVEVQGLTKIVSDINGYFHLSLYETTTVNASLEFSAVYPPTGLPLNTFNFGKALIPNVPEINFSDLIFS